MVGLINHPDGSNTLVYLPPEIITQILSYLPVQSLLNLKRVCRTWRSEISSSEFTKTHLNRLKYSKDYSNHRVILQFIKTRHQIFYTCPLSSILDKTAPFQPKRLCLPPSLLPYKWTFLYGNCNGLLCVRGDKSTLVLLNPATRKLKRLPDCGFERYTVTCGLCYHELDDDYRVVQLHSTGDNVYGVNIYSLRSNSWTKINDVFDCSDYNGRIWSLPGLAIGALLHWPIYNSFWHILVVDTVTYTHGTLAGPKYDHIPCDGEWGVMDFGGCLGLYQVSPQTEFHIWTMKESWSKVLSLNCCGVNNDSWRTFPLVGLKNGEVLVGNEPTHSIVYKSRENAFVTKTIPDFYVSPYAGNPIYYETLVAPSFDDL